MPEPAAPAGDEKICSCCGTPNPQEADFCAVCGVDLN
jgi:ribosomal protein L40E